MEGSAAAESAGPRLGEVERVEASRRVDLAVVDHNLPADKARDRACLGHRRHSQGTRAGLVPVLAVVTAKV